MKTFYASFLLGAISTTLVFATLSIFDATKALANSARTVTALNDNKQLIARTITFAGLEWNVKSGKAGPRNNNWLDDPQSVWVDKNGWLHLKIRKIGGTWYSSEIYSKKKFGYGEYLFHVTGKLDDYDPNIVLGLFSYNGDNNEIDIEIANFDDINAPKKSVYHTVQPDMLDSKLPAVSEHVPLNLEGTATSHKYIWQNSGIKWQSYYGHYPAPPSKQSLIKETESSQYKPQPDAEIRINFWLLDEKNGPKNQQEAEVIIKNVFFKQI